MLRGRRNADAVIVGGGFTGLHTALWLARAGLHVIVLEAETLGCGASSRCAGLAAITMSERFSRTERVRGREVAAAYGRTQQAAFQALRDLACEQGMRSRWRDTDAFLVAQNEQDAVLLEHEANAMRRAGVGATLTQATQCLLPVKAAICLRDQATLDPYLHLASVAVKAERLNVAIFEHSRVISLESNIAYTERGSVLAPYMVIATGYPVVNTPGWYFLRLMQRQGALMALRDTVPFEGMYMDCRGRFSIREQESETLFAMFDGRAGAQRFPARELFARRYARELGVLLPERAYVGYETYSADGMPFIGAYGRKTPNLFTACGYSGCGLVGSVAAAQIISAKVLGLPVADHDVYSGQRVSLPLLRCDLRTVGAQTAGYLKGLVHWRAPRCPHLGCKLVYRGDTHSWVCPCHGSRFDAIGRVQAAPAVRDAVIRHKNRT